MSRRDVRRIRSSPPQRERLAEAVRHLVDAMLTVEDATEEQLGTAADMTEAVAAPPRPRAATRDDADRGVRAAYELDHDDYLPRSPLVGEVSPLAPPIDWEVVDGRDRRPRHASTPRTRARPATCTAAGSR